MATFVFENMTQAQADAFTSADILAVATTSANARNVGVSFTAATLTANDLITMTIGTKVLTFGAAPLSIASDAGSIVFNDNSSLVLGTSGGDTGLTGATNPNTVYLFGGNDGFTSTGTNSEDFIFGMGGNDTITGGSTASHLYGFNASGGTDGNDSLTGGAAGDYLQGNSGTDVLDGGDGSDRILGGAGNDTVQGTGNGNDSINGNTGNDQLDGGADNDLVRGGAGNDSVSGGGGNDQVLGDLGTDTLDGGAGIDSFTGGGGNDILGFLGSNGTGSTVSSVTYYDTVLDYTDGEDEFRFSATGSGGTTTFGDDTGDINIGVAGATFTTVSAATTYAQQLLDANTAGDDIAIVKVGSDTYVFWDSTGTNGAAIDSIVKLQGVSDTSLFTIADFG